MYVKPFHPFWNSRSPDEKKFESLEKKRATALEMAQKKDAKTKAKRAQTKIVKLFISNIILNIFSGIILNIIFHIIEVEIPRWLLYGSMG